MYWLRLHYHVKDIAVAPYKIKKKSKQKWQNRRQSVIEWCVVLIQMPSNEFDGRWRYSWCVEGSYSCRLQHGRHWANGSWQNGWHASYHCDNLFKHCAHLVEYSAVTVWCCQGSFSTVVRWSHVTVFTGCLQLLQILEISCNLIALPGNFYIIGWWSIIDKNDIQSYSCGPVIGNWLA